MTYFWIEPDLYSSLLEWLPRQDYHLYGPSKAFMHGLIQELRPVFGKRNIQISVVYPGPLQTGFHQAAGVPATARPPDWDSLTQVSREILQAVARREPYVFSDFDPDWVATCVGLWQQETQCKTQLTEDLSHV